MSLPRYSEYKDSRVKWLGNVPAHWDVQRLKYACEVFPSNVDKHSRDDEPSVLLCNYTDVYYNERINPDMQFMEATASPEQIARFTLRAGDTIITKDSETADDIAIAAFVPQDIPGVICGYHLSMIRPRRGTSGAFVKRLFDSLYAKACFAVAANGLTRVGLGQYALDNVELPFPPFNEQIVIAAFLDSETAKIDALIAEQEKLLPLLAEKRQATISRAVTCGLNSDVPMKDSGVEWLGMVPMHWEIYPLKRRLTFLTSGSRGWAEHYADDGALFIRIGNLTRDDVRLDLTDVQRVAVPVGSEGERTRVRPGDILFSITAYLGSVAIVPEDIGQAFVSQHVALARLRDDSILPSWVAYVALSTVGKTYLETQGYGGTKVQLSLEDVANMLLTVPPPEEQSAIVAFVEMEISKIDVLETEAERAIELLKERRSALISATVTGKIDVRNVPHCGKLSL